MILGGKDGRESEAEDAVSNSSGTSTVRDASSTSSIPADAELLDASAVHDPDKKFLSDYLRMYSRLCSLGTDGQSPSPPGQFLPGVPELRDGLKKAIEALGGATPSGQCS
jgi:hypothetical protein